MPLLDMDQNCALSVCDDAKTPLTQCSIDSWTFAHGKREKWEEQFSYFIQQIKTMQFALQQLFAAAHE